jgi:HPt (histidine-containing phosphotransfer) domain-containing protein
MPSIPPPNPTLAHLAAALSEEDARELVRIFLSEFPTLREALANGNRRQSYLAAHSLKSSAQHMGLTALAERMSELERRLEESDAALDAEDVAGIDRDFEQEAASLRAFAGE